MGQTDIPFFTQASLCAPTQDEMQSGYIALIDKEIGWSSFDIVAKVRNRLTRYYGQKNLKVGHGGTLDPLASGLVIVCIGKATKSSQLHQDNEKEYIASVELGSVTASFDKETPTENHLPIDHITAAEIQRVLDEHFTGVVTQYPPIFSAKSVNGTRAYLEARKGRHVDMPAISIEIKRAHLIDYQAPHATIQIVCSKGTYIRSIAQDLGQLLGCGAHLAGLRRTRSGGCSIDDALTVDQLLALFPSGSPQRDCPVFSRGMQCLTEAENDNKLITN